MGYRRYGWGLADSVTPAVQGLLVANGVVYLLQMLWDSQLVFLFGLTPTDFWDHRAFWQPVTYMFLHGGVMHLVLNMLALWMFGSALESYWGTRLFLRYYFLTGVGAGLCNALLTPDSQSVIIGASGAIYGLLAAYGLLFPNSIIYIYIFFPIRAKYLVLIFGLIEFFASLRPGVGTVAHLVHLGGMVIGLIYLRWRFVVNWVGRTRANIERERRFQAHQRENESKDSLRREVDDLLDKINEVGLENLTSWEKRRLRDASERLKEGRR